MVGDHTIDGTILQPLPKRVSIFRVTNRRIHQHPLSQLFDIILIEGQMLGTHLCSDEIGFVFMQPIRFLLTCQMDYVETMFVILS